MFGTKDEVDPVRHLIGTANGWGGNPREGRCTQRRPAAERRQHGVPADGQGRAGGRVLVGQRVQQGRLLREEPAGAYSVNNLTAKPNADGSVTIQFGGCTERAQLPTDRAGLELHGPPVPSARRRSSTAPGSSRRPSRSRAPARWSPRSCAPADRGAPVGGLERVGSLTVTLIVPAAIASSSSPARQANSSGVRVKCARSAGSGTPNPPR